MNCANKFCIYWSNEKCILDSVSLNFMGMCEDCIYVNISENSLATYRKTLLNKIDNY